MNAVLLDIPLEPGNWPAWLEQQLLGFNLRQLIDQLKLVVPATDAPSRSLEQICGPQLPQVLTAGLTILSPEQIRELLRHPDALLDLQEQVLIDGGAYWQNLSVAAQDPVSTASTWQALETRLDSSTSNAILASVHENRAERTWLRNLVLLVAAVVIAVGINIIRPTPAGPAWGFDRPGALAQNLPADRYLEHLADAAQEWYTQRPDSSDKLSRRLREFRRGCDTLLAAPHTQLAATDREWLRERCRVWASKIDAHLADLSTGKKTVMEVRESADQTINQLVKALQDRATKV